MLALRGEEEPLGLKVTNFPPLVCGGVSSRICYLSVSLVRATLIPLRLLMRFCVSTFSAPSLSYLEAFCEGTPEWLVLIAFMSNRTSGAVDF